MKNPLVILYLVDGARPDVLGELLASGDLPSIRRDVVDAGTLRTLSSCLPTTTGPAYLPFLTGCFPGTLNIPGIRWLDKAEFSRRRLGRDGLRSYMGYGAMRFNDDLPVDCPTLFELFQKPFNIHSMITRGLPRRRNLTARSKLFWYGYAHVTDRWHDVDRAAHRHLMRALDHDPDFIFAVFPGVDSYSHLLHPRHEHTLRAYRLIDFSVGQVVVKLKRLGRWDETLLIITSDHGLTATHTHFDLATFLERRGIKTLYYPVIWKKKPKASVMISGNSLAHVYWLDGLAGEPMNGREVNAAFGPAWNELLQREEIDFVAQRAATGTYEIVSARGRALIDRRPDGWRYRPVVGDPLGLGSWATGMDHQRALEKTFDSQYPDALVQIDQLLSAPRAGDVVVLSKPGYDLRDAFEWPEHHGSHGSLHREHMLVPLLYNRTGWDTRPARTADLFNTILRWSGRPTREHVDGKALL